MFIYSKSSGVNNAAIGKLETPIKMLIENESNKYAKQGGVCKWLYNVEKSNKFGETIVAQSDFDIFQATAEGDPASIDTVSEAYRKFIEHIQFTKEFSISAEMMEDANYGIAADAKRRIENFTRAYYKTIDRICEKALADGAYRTTSIAGATIDLTTGDSLPLFSNKHKWGVGDKTGVQSNFYKADCFTNDDGEYDGIYFNEYLTEFSSCMRNMYDESGEILGYVPDTIILPGNKAGLEGMIKRFCGSEYMPGTSHNDINIHYGRWNIVVMPHWQAPCDQIMLMSSEANKNLGGNMFFNRVPLTVTNWVENHTGNYIWNGRCRFGVGFGTYKHILLITSDLNESEANEI